MFISDHYDSFAFRALEFRKFVTIANCAHVLLIGMQEIYRPVFCLATVVSKWSRNLEFYRPFVRDKKIRCSPRSYKPTVFRASIQILCDKLNQLGFAIRSNAGLKRPERDSLRIGFHQAISNIGDCVF